MHRPQPAPTRRTASRRRPRTHPAIAASITVALLLAGCSGGDSGGSDGEPGATTTTAPPVTTTAPKPLAEGAEDWELAYLSTDADQTTVFLTNAKGEDQEVVAKLPGRAEALRWSPDGSKLLLDGDGSGDFEVSVIDVESGEVRALAPSAGSNEGGAAWSPDGSQVAFFSNREGPGFAGYVVDATGGEPRRITPPETQQVADLAWSPDGSTIAFSNTEGLDSSVWTVAPDGTGATEVSTEPGSTQPAWSPDGDLLAISAQPLGEPAPGVYLLDRETGDTTELANSEFRDAFPVWAPEGDRVYFVSAVPNEDAEGGAADDILVVGIDGGKPEPVISDPISVESELTPTSDGTLIAFSVQRLGDKEVFVANADGSGAIPVSRSERLDSWPAWRPGTGPDADTDA